MTPHKHADLIKAWANGAEIQFKNKVNSNWESINKPSWHEDFEYRIKPEKPEPKFKLGDFVYKKSGSAWSGYIVGTYSTRLTPEGYAVESYFHTGSVQIYPVGALKGMNDD